MARILIVDDEKGLRRSTAIAFQLSGHQVEEAATGNEALQLVQKDIFDLIITDLVMEDIDGLELIKKIKLLCPTSSIYFTKCSNPQIRLQKYYYRKS
jgi:CheY-like chemotaxis protein